MLLALGLVALNLRPAVTSIGPLLDEISTHLGLAPTGKTILTTLPVICFGLASPIAPLLGRRFGAENMILYALIGLAVGCGIRLIPSAPVLYLSAVIAGVSIGVMNVLLPGIVKRDFPERVGAVTGFYTMVLCVGAGGAAALSPKIEQLFDAIWPTALASWAILALIAVPAWLPMRASFHSAPRAGATGAGNLWRNALAWQVTLYLGLCSAGAYTVFGWGAKILQDRGMEKVDSGLMIGLSLIAQAVGAQVAPLMAGKSGDLRLATILMQVLGLIGLLGYLFAPLGLIWPSSILLGLGQGGAFALALTMIAQRGGNPETAARLSGMSQSAGYFLGALAGPFAVGLVHDSFGGWPPVAILIVIITVGSALFGLGAGRVRTV